MLDGLEWRELKGTPEGDLPYATHEGILAIGEYKMRVYQLNDGRRVINGEDIAGFFGFFPEGAA
jgi:hypothetical protein